MNVSFKRFLCAVCALTLCSCAAFAETPAEPVELIVFAAASLTETLTQIKALYEQEHPETTIIYNFDSSGTLKTQIESGAECDVFISAAPKQMNQLDISADETANPGRLDFVLQGTRIDLLENKVAHIIKRLKSASEAGKTIVLLDYDCQVVCTIVKGTTKYTR